MKIFILSDPSSIHTKRWVSALAERDIHIFLFGLSSNNIDFYLKYDNVLLYKTDHINRLKRRTKSGSFEKLKYLIVFQSLKKCIKDFQPDILHAHYASSYGLLGALTGFHPYIISVWGSDVYDFPNVSFLHKKILEYNLSKADCILSTSHIMANEARKYTNKHVQITPFGVDLTLFKKNYTTENEHALIIGTVKALVANYGIDVLIKSFKILLDNNPHINLRLKIVGDGEDKDKFISLASSLKIEDKIDFVGKIANENVPNYFNSFLVSVFLSVKESFGVAAVEAMACECPVVVSDADGFTEVVVNNETGFIVPQKDIQATVNAIQKFVDDPKLREKMGEAGRNRVCELYNWENNVTQMVNIYDNILKT